jgi:hypothetical protein
VIVGKVCAKLLFKDAVTPNKVVVLVPEAPDVMVTSAGPIVATLTVFLPAVRLVFASSLVLLISVPCCWVFGNTVVLENCPPPNSVLGAVALAGLRDGLEVAAFVSLKFWVELL